MWRPTATGAGQELVCQNDAAPYNAAWDNRRLDCVRLGLRRASHARVGPSCHCLRLGSLHARHVVLREGFTVFGDRRRRLAVFLDAYGWTGDISGLTQSIRHRLTDHINGLQRLATAGDPLFQIVDRPRQW